MKKNRLLWPRCALAVAGAVAMSLSACGGGDTASAPALPMATSTNSVPAQTSVSVAALIRWASNLPRDDVTEPLNTDAFHPPVDDGAEPTSVH